MLGSGVNWVIRWERRGGIAGHDDIRRDNFGAEDGKLAVFFAIGFTAEDVVDFVEDGGALFFGEFALGVEHFLLRGLGLGVVVFLELEDFAADAGQAVDETGEGEDLVRMG